MSDEEFAPLHAFDPNAELFFGLVAAVGTDLPRFETKLSESLRHYKYDPRPIRISKLLRPVETGVDTSLLTDATPEVERINLLMTAGNNLRKTSGRLDILALQAAAYVASKREGNRSSLDAHAAPKQPNSEISEEPKPLERTAFILNSLKRPEEVATLRHIYGPGFFLIGVYSPVAIREANLARKRGTREDIDKLFKRDESEADENGQRTRDTFQLSDVFLRFGIEESAEDDELWRFLDLVFGHPFHSPTKDEHAMFLAHSSALRSADLSRQVGAVIESKDGDVVAGGCNDVPRAHGGLYWPIPLGKEPLCEGDAADKRDYVLGRDFNEKIRNDLLDEILGICASKLKGLNPPSEPEKTFLGRVLQVVVDRTGYTESQLFDITEYGRAVHAEMEALLSAARNRVSPQDGRLFSTTFPCHNCAKHVVASGIREVVFIEPYPKSRAGELFEDSIVIDPDPKKPSARRIPFLHFSGIGPRRYVDLFSLQHTAGHKRQRKEDDGTAVNWNKAQARPRVPLAPYSYLDQESRVVRWMNRSSSASGPPTSSPTSTGSSPTPTTGEAES